MPAEAKRFAVVDRVWRELMEETSVSNAVLKVTEREGTLMA